MKATITILIAVVLTLSVNVLFAGNDITSVPAANANAVVTLTSLAPTVPMEATFEDAVVLNDLAYLAPTTPTEAQFEDLSIELISALNLAPLTPAAADFEDEIDFNSLAPIVPVEADFE
jgi:hypothetical protein